MLTKGRLKRKTRIRAKISGTTEKPRLSVFRSNKFMYVQAIDDSKSVTIAHAKGPDAKVVGTEIAKALKAKKVEKVVFDRGGYRYHGRVRDLANAAREGGLNF